MLLAIVASHPVQYQVPLFRELARRCELMTYFAHRASVEDQADAGFGVGFAWDVDLLSNYPHKFLVNVAGKPGLDHFSGCNTPGIGAEFARSRPDAVVLMGWYLKCYWQAIWGAKCLGIPVMVRGDSHLATPGSLVKRVGKAAVYPIALRVFDAALYVGEQSRRYWEHYGYPRHRMFFSPHCVDNNWFAARATPQARAELRALHGISQTAKVFLFVGKLQDFKRAGDVVVAAAMLGREHQDVTILIAGAGSEEKRIEELARKHGIKMVQLGFCNQSQMPAVYAAADFLVLPSEHETWGLVANEALACGVPVIVSEACGCAQDLAADGTAGRIVPVGNFNALAATMRELITAPPTRDAIAAKAAQYNVSAAADGIEDAVRAVTHQRG
jgi:glycosyltransferase involved in cell wall biosynthesis